jgi:ABC-2 type transport system ATP-binding protein
MLNITNLSYNYKNLAALTNINLSFSRPSLIGLLGHNGSGKSTLLKILGASMAVQSGEISIFGTNALDKHGFIAASKRSFLGVVFQSTSSDLALSARDNLRYFARLMNIARKDQEFVVNKFLNLATLTDRSQEALKKLSHGMRRRLEVYRAFMHKPKILLLDEPTESLDSYESARFLDFVKNYAMSEQALVILATHKSQELECCDKIIMLHQGAKISESTPKELLANLNFVKVEVSIKATELHKWQGPQEITLKPYKDNPALLHAQIKASLLPDLLASPALKHHAIESVRWQRPQLDDAYELHTRAEAEHYVN